MREIFSGQHFIQHGHCYLWKPGLLGLQATSNLLIALACLVAAAQVYRALRRAPRRPRLLPLAAGLFLFGGGLTHLMNVVVVWNPLYWVDGALRAVTALSGLAAIVTLPRVLCASSTASESPPPA